MINLLPFDLSTLMADWLLKRIVVAADEDDGDDDGMVMEQGDPDAGDAGPPTKMCG